MLETGLIREEPHRLCSSGMVAGPPGLHGASAAVAVVSGLKYANNPSPRHGGRICVGQGREER